MDDPERIERFGVLLIVMLCLCASVLMAVGTIYLIHRIIEAW